MGSLRLAFSLIRIPRLFATLFLLPILLSIALVYIQLVLTGILLKVTPTDADDVEQHYKQAKELNLSRRILYGDSKRLAPLKICRWVLRPTATHPEQEAPPGPECAPDRLDIAIQVKEPASFEAEEYRRIFEGNVERLHICRSCHPDLIITNADDSPRIDSYSLQALLVLSLVTFNDDVHAQYIAARQGYDRIRRLLGEIYFHAKDLRHPVKLNDLETSLALIFNIAFLIVISLWLALKAHRRVLDYFVRNGALLPMVAASGKNNFYSAIWILTLLRVAAFLSAAGPLTYYGFISIINKQKLQNFLGNDPLEFVLWALAIGASLSLATLVASIADLKHRRHIMTVVYRYIPLLVCFLGAILWLATLLFDQRIFGWLRSLIAALPVMGIAPVLVAPVFKPQLEVLVTHTLLTAGIMAVMLKQNARWFAAHLEEL